MKRSRELVKLERLEVLRTDRVRPVARLEAPTAERHGDKIRVLGMDLDTDQARAMWATLGELLEETQQLSRPTAWGWLRAWLDHAFAAGAELEGRAVGTRDAVIGSAVRSHKVRGLFRTGVFQVAHLRRRPSGVWSGPVADYFPGSSGLGPRQPDALIAFTGRRVTVRGIDLLPVHEYP